MQIHVGIQLRIVDGRTNPCARGEMDHGVDVVGQPRIDIRIPDIAPHFREGPERATPREITFLDRGIVERVEIVENHHPVARAEQPLPQMGPDEAGASRDEDSHWKILAIRGLLPSGLTLLRCGADMYPPVVSSWTPSPRAGNTLAPDRSMEVHGSYQWGLASSQGAKRQPTSHFEADVEARVRASKPPKLEYDPQQWRTFAPVPSADPAGGSF